MSVLRVEAPAKSNKNKGSSISEVIFLGTGTSSGIPSVPCLVRTDRKCKVCLSSMTKEGEKNRRRNTSILVRIVDENQELKNVLVDCGKTFYEGSIDQFPKNNVQSIDAVLLTHGHADAILGLDDLRQWTVRKKETLNVYLNQETYDVVSTTFPYIVDIKKATGGGEVPVLDFIIFDNESVLNVFGIDFTPLPVEHGLYSNGDPYFSLGFRFGGISYISDCNLIPETTQELIKTSDVLVIDCLKWDSHLSHFGYDDAMNTILLHRPQLSILTDFCHSIDHYELLDTLIVWQKENSLNVVPSFDGQVLKVNEKSYDISL
ncbi:putative hydrolase [Smittium mucronatum]|uniref:Putative hydrolase n=1 Tax=Smittium mucronatum TaxID=133383 RepID=A0A1R0H705_9FUNG|nr:putative hydrolase [Smittium mucronatum]